MKAIFARHDILPSSHIRIWNKGLHQWVDMAVADTVVGALANTAAVGIAAADTGAVADMELVRCFV